ncbi:hypothetical protein [Nonomuraea sp. NPDC049141]|uniref:hypothetical protein n=1 Tax=Nonomuraea sp. NPDC049141 TaxID=3155500 RepID=UPI0033C40C77
MFIVAVSGLVVGTHAGQATSRGTGMTGFLGRVSNQTFYDITAVRFNTSIDHEDCTVWNGRDGGPQCRLDSDLAGTFAW